MLDLGDGRTAKITYLRRLQFVPASRKLDGPPARTEIDPKGGTTVAEVYEGERVVGMGVAICHPRESFNKKLGRHIAIQRALKHGDVPTRLIEDVTS